MGIKLRAFIMPDEVLCVSCRVSSSEAMNSLVPEQRLAFNPRMAGVGIIICRYIRTAFRDLSITRFQRFCFSSSRQHSLCSGSVPPRMSSLTLMGRQVFGWERFYLFFMDRPNQCPVC